MSILKDLRWGIVAGLFFACFYSLIALAILLFGGGKAFEATGVTIPIAIAGYFAGGLVAGALVGLLRPFAKRRIGAVAVGIGAAFPVMLGFGFIMYGPMAQWDGGAIFGVTFAAVFLGGYGGWEFWEPQG